MAATALNLFGTTGFEAFGAVARTDALDGRLALSDCDERHSDDRKRDPNRLCADERRQTASI